jgi:hypothetical protein
MQLVNLLSAHRIWTEATVFGSHILYSDKRLVIMTIENAVAAHFWSEGTRWCIADSSCFYDYRQHGPLIFFKSLADEKCYLLAPAALEFRNGRNRRLSLEVFLERFPNCRVLIKKALRNDWRASLYFNLVPDGATFEHSVNLKGLEIIRLPNGLHIRNDLILSNNPISKLPNSLYVGGDLVVRCTNIDEIPDGVVVMGSILR